MDEYPTEEQLKQIETWPTEDFHGLMAFIKPLWKYAEIGYWTQEGESYSLSTGGWSGNDELITALRANYLFWAFYWYQSTRGGQYIFKPIREQTHG